MTDAETMKAFRAKMLGWTQKQAAEALGVTIAQVAAIENGRSKLTAQTRILMGFYLRQEAPLARAPWNP